MGQQPRKSSQTFKERGRRHRLRKSSTQSEMVSLMKMESEDNNLDYLHCFFFWLRLQWIFKVSVRGNSNNSYDEFNKNPRETVSKRGFFV